NMRKWSMRFSAMSSVAMPGSPFGSVHHTAAPIVLESVPEHGDGVEHLVRPLEESRLIELRREEHLFELVHCVLGMLGFPAVVPREESNLQVGKPGRLDVQQAILELLPEARRGPILDREARSLGDSIVFTAEESDQFVAELECRRRALLALPQV